MLSLFPVAFILLNLSPFARAGICPPNCEREDDTPVKVEKTGSPVETVRLSCNKPPLPGVKLLDVVFVKDPADKTGHVNQYSQINLTLSDGKVAKHVGDRGSVEDQVNFLTYSVHWPKFQNKVGARDNYLIVTPKPDSSKWDYVLETSKIGTDITKEKVSKQITRADCKVLNAPSDPPKAQDPASSSAQ